MCGTVQLYTCIWANQISHLNQVATGFHCNCKTLLCSPLTNKKVLPLHFTSPNVLFDFEQHSGHTFKPLDEVYDQHVSSITDEVGF